MLSSVSVKGPFLTQSNAFLSQYLDRPDNDKRTVLTVIRPPTLFPKRLTKNIHCRIFSFKFLPHDVVSVEKVAKRIRFLHLPPQNVTRWPLSRSRKANMIRKDPICSQHGHSITQWKQKKLFWKVDCENPAFNLTVSMYWAQVTCGLRLCAHCLLKTKHRSYSYPFNVGHGHCQEAWMLFSFLRAHTCGQWHVSSREAAVEWQLQVHKYSLYCKLYDVKKKISLEKPFSTQGLQPIWGWMTLSQGSYVRYLHYD